MFQFSYALQEPPRSPTVGSAVCDCVTSICIANALEVINRNWTKIVHAQRYQSMIGAHLLSIIQSESMQFQTLVSIFMLFVALACADEASCGSNYCEEDPNYPEQSLDQLNLWQYDFDVLEENSQSADTSAGDQARPKRSLDASGFLVEEKLCKSVCRNVRLQKMRNVNDEMRTIVNHRNYTQNVMMETCSTENFPCTFNIYPKSVKSFCQQKYSVRKLLAFDEVNRCVVRDKFLIPSSCDCLIDKEDWIAGWRQ